MRTLEKIATDLRAELGAEVFIVAIKNVRPDPADGTRSLFDYDWYATNRGGVTEAAVAGAVEQMKAVKT